MATSLASMAQKALLDEITASISKQCKHATFACGGGIPVRVPPQGEKSTSPTAGAITDSASTANSSCTTPVQLRFGEQGQGFAVKLPGDDAGSEAVQQLIAACVPAPFGRGKEDVLDERYRKASKLDTDQFTTSFCPYESGIIDIISQVLLPNVIDAGSEKRSVRAELYKLNFYSAPSGKFKAHRDTPRGDKQFGSLVVCLPLAHEGGQLLVRNDQKELVFDWSTANAKTNSSDLAGTGSNAPSAIKWAAFYSDCEHEVLEVTSGHRLTLTYNLYVTRGAGNLAGHVSNGVLDPTQLPLYSTLKYALATPGFLTGGRILGVYLTHIYAHTMPNISFLPSSLKGADMALFEAARALELACYVRAVIPVESYDHRTGDASVNAHLMRREFSAFISSHFSNESGDTFADAMKDEGWNERWNERKVTWLNTLTNEMKEPAVGYATYGNSAVGATGYSAAALLIRVPQMSERGKNESLELPKDMFQGIAADEKKTDVEGDSQDAEMTDCEDEDED